MHLQECRLNRGNARSGLKSRVESMFHGSKFILQPRISTAEPSFSVVHYAGHVNYQTRDLIEKNKVTKAAMFVCKIIPLHYYFTSF